MESELDEQITSSLQRLALLMTVHCVRNTVIENYHANGQLPDKDMKAFNKEVSNRLYTVLLVLFHPKYGHMRSDYLQSLEYAFPYNWDMPRIEEGLSPDPIAHS